MSAKSQPERLLDQLEFLFERYSLEPRSMTQPFLLGRVQQRVPGYAYDPEDPVIRESLMEHVGSLPMVATTIFPHISDSEVDLGQALVMLAVHDIGELVIHDEITFTKDHSSNTEEQDAALSLLDPSYHALYDDVESQTSTTAKFAKAIDKITPDIWDYLTPADITAARLKHFVGVDRDQIVDLIVKHKRPYMLWNPFMTEFHILLMDKLAAKLSAPASKRSK
jgi:hypothetical protein